MCAISRKLFDWYSLGIFFRAVNVKVYAFFSYSVKERKVMYIYFRYLYCYTIQISKCIDTDFRTDQKCRMFFKIEYLLQCLAYFFHWLLDLQLSAPKKCFLSPSFSLPLTFKYLQSSRIRQQIAELLIFLIWFSHSQMCLRIF